MSIQLEFFSFFFLAKVGMLNLLLNHKLLMQVSLKMKSKMELLYIPESHVHIALKSSIEHLDILLYSYSCEQVGDS